MTQFDELVTARKDWINNVLKPWCQQARRAELRKAEVEWLDIAGKVAADKTLWLWAWSRFPELVHDSLGSRKRPRLSCNFRTAIGSVASQIHGKASMVTCYY